MLRYGRTHCGWFEIETRDCKYLHSLAQPELPSARWRRKETPSDFISNASTFDSDIVPHRGCSERQGDPFCEVLICHLNCKHAVSYYLE
jgi:hypothetical protein